MTKGGSMAKKVARKKMVLPTPSRGTGKTYNAEPKQISIIKRCFIENDFNISYDDVEDFIEDTGKHPDDIFNTIIGSASEKQKEVWEAIINHDEIWIKTAFYLNREIENQTKRLTQKPTKRK